MFHGTVELHLRFAMSFKLSTRKCRSDVHVMKLYEQIHLYRTARLRNSFIRRDEKLVRRGALRGKKKTVLRKIRKKTFNVFIFGSTADSRYQLAYTVFYRAIMCDSFPTNIRGSNYRR